MLAALSRGDFESLLDTHAVIASKIALQLARQLGPAAARRSASAEQKIAVRRPGTGRDPGANRYLSSGPLVWVATIVCTTLLLVLLRQALWLVVPFLFAIILYYALFPAVRRLTLAGIRPRDRRGDRRRCLLRRRGRGDGARRCPGSQRRPSSARRRCSATSRAAGVLLDRTLIMLEAQFGFLSGWISMPNMGRKIAEFGGGYIQQHLTDALLGAAAWLPALLLAPFLAFFFLRDGRRFLKFVGRGGAERLFRADALHGRARRRHRARLLPGSAQAHASSTPSVSRSACG